MQAGVIKCNAPPHEAGYVPLQLLYEGEACSGTTIDFEFRSQVVKQKRKRSREEAEVFQGHCKGSLLDADPRESKVRIVERLTYINESCSAFNTVETPVNQTPNTALKAMLQTIDLQALDTLETSLLIAVTEKVVQCLFQCGLE